MALVSGSVPNLINGVSQQPPSLRLDSQCERQVNGLSDVVAGLSKRPPTQSILQLKTTDPLGATYLSTTDIAKAYIHTYKRSATEQYMVVVIPDATTPVVYAYDIDGKLRYESGVGSWDSAGSLIAANTDDTSYLITTDGLENFRTTSIADRTYIVNKATVVAKDSTLYNPVRPNEALFFLKQVNYSKQYYAELTITDDGANNGDTFDGVYITSDSTISDIRSSTVIAALRTDLIAPGSEQTQTIPYRSNLHQFTDPVTNHLTYTLNGSVKPTDAAEADALIVVTNGAILDRSKYTFNAPTYTELTFIDIWDIVVPGTYHSDEYDLSTITFTKVGGSDISQTDFKIVPYAYSSEPWFVISSRTLPFSVIATDDNGGNDLKVFKDTAKSFTDLPAEAPVGYTIAVIGDNNKDEDDFYVSYVGDTTAGVWKEVTQPGVESKIDSTTMPYSLQQNSDLSFTFDTVDWSGRKAGGIVNDGLDTNPFPSFLGATINDVFFYRNRLGILSGENVIFSEAGEYENFFRTTVRTLLDSDPIDVAVSQNEVSDLLHAVPFQENLLIFSNLNQFTLSSDTLLTPTEVSINTSTRFECNLAARPRNAGNSVYFAVENGSYTGIREYVTQGDAEVKDAPLVTAHVPEYIRGGATKLIASSNEDMLIVQTDDDLNTVYIYRWYNQGNERLQSAWSEWTFDQDVIDISLNNTRLYILFGNGEYEFLELTAPIETVEFSETNAVTATTTPGQEANWNFVSTMFFNSSTQMKGVVEDNHSGAWVPLDPADDPMGSVDNSVFSNTADYVEEAYVVWYNWDVGLGLNNDYYFELKRPTGAVEFESIIIGAYTWLWADFSDLGGGYLRKVITSIEYAALFNGATEDITFVLSSGDVPYDASVHNVLLDHRKRLTGLANVAAVQAAYNVQPSTKFIDYKGLIVAVGDSTSELQKVVDHLAGIHLEDGVITSNYVDTGEPYTLTYELSEQVFKPSENDPSELGRFQLGKMSFNFSNSGAFDVTVASTGRDAKTSSFTPRTLGSSLNLIGFSVVPVKGTWPVSILAQSKETSVTITNDSHLPSTFQTVEWEGYITYRNTRI